MKKSAYFMIAALFLFTLSGGCKGETAQKADQSSDTAPPAESLTPMTGGISGRVVETINTAGYTYVHVDTGDKSIWAAAPEFQVKVNDRVTVPQGTPMRNFQSKTLDRTFEVVYFVSSIMVEGANAAGAQVPAGHQALGKDGKAAAGAEMDFSTIKKPEGGKTVAEVYAEKSELKDKSIKLRGKVVKFNPNIMQRNWIHLQDGTGAEGVNDLTITTTGSAAVGDTVVVEGILAVDKDFGSGYKYAVIIENCTLTVE